MASRRARRPKRPKPSELLAEIYAQFPDPPGAERIGIDVSDRHAMAAFIRRHLLRKRDQGEEARDKAPARVKRPAKS